MSRKAVPPCAKRPSLVYKVQCKGRNVVAHLFIGESQDYHILALCGTLRGAGLKGWSKLQLEELGKRAQSGKKLW